MKATARPTRRLDGVLLTIVAVCAVASAVVADREEVAATRWALVHMPGWVTYFNRPGSLLPDGMRALRLPATRLYDDLTAGLMVAGSGLTLLAYWPRRGRPKVRSGPGQVASAIAAMGLLGRLILAGLDRLLRLLPVLPPGMARNRIPGAPSNDWSSLAEAVGRQVPWIILAAWAYLWLTRQWRPPVDLNDVMGRWVGWGWVISIGLTAARTVLNWL